MDNYICKIGDVIELMPFQEDTPNDANSNQANGQVTKNSTTMEAEMVLAPYYSKSTIIVSLCLLQETDVKGESANVDTKCEKVFEEHVNIKMV